MSEKKRSLTPWETGFGLALIAAIALAALVLRVRAVHGDREEQAPAAEPAPSVERPSDPLAVFGGATTIRHAVSMIDGALGDHHGDNISPGAALFALWMQQRRPADHWAELDSMPDHRRVEVIKDPSQFRGVKLCNRGTVTQIVADRSAAKPVWIGVLDTGVVDLIRFVAVGSSSGVTEGTRARFCGVVIGLHSYDTLLGGRATGVEVVGLFDLPENRSAR